MHTCKPLLLLTSQGHKGIVTGDGGPYWILVLKIRDRGPDNNMVSSTATSPTTCLQVRGTLPCMIQQVCQNHRGLTRFADMTCTAHLSKEQKSNIPF